MVRSEACLRLHAIFVICVGLLISFRNLAASSFPTVDEPIEGFGVVDAFSGIQFDQPVALATPAGETNALFVVERLGKLYAITNLARPNKTLVLDLTASTVSDGGYEPGLLGLAFHPNFRTNGYFFLYRTLLGSDGYYDRLSRFRADPKTFQTSADTEEVVLQQQDLRFIQHNAGDIHFGPDGYLYISLGESSPPQSDYKLTRQPIDKNFFGVMLRIDVDKRPGNLPPNPHPGVGNLYLVPKDNPFVGATQYQGVPLNTSTLRTEIFALGLRNPWRFSFDPVTGEVFCGDVGEQTFEEVNIIHAGGNYGWPYMEGVYQTDLYGSRPSGFSSEPPLWQYGHDSTQLSGQAVIGGYVYSGSAVPGLQRAYIFGDNVRGNIWALTRNAGQGTVQVKWLTGEPSLSTFGVDPRDNEILLASLITGKIRKLVYRDPVGSTVPEKLSSTGLFTDTASLTPALGLTPYNINVPFWSDAAFKQRWYVLPNNSFFGLDSNNRWSSPVGTIWVKHFDLETTRGDPNSRRRLETRILVKAANSTYGLTYKWNASGTDAELLDSAGMDEQINIVENGASRLQRWHYPSRLECRLCHNPIAGDALGFSGEQLNCPDAAGVNQLARLDAQGSLKGFQPSAPPLPLAVATNRSAPVEYRVRSFMQANCAQCHVPGNPIVATWDARFRTALPDKVLAGLVVPGDPDNSMLYTRLAVLDWLHMPPISTSEVNPEAVQLVREWISGLGLGRWQHVPLGSPLTPGTSLAWTNSIETTAYGDLSGQEAGEYTYRLATGSVHLVTRIGARHLSGLNARAGIRFGSTKASGGGYFAGITPTGWFSQTLANGSISQASAATDSVWLRVSAEPDGIRLFKLNGQTWENLETVSNSLANISTIGVAVTTSESDEQFARFESVSALSAYLRLVGGQTNQTVQTQNTIECVLDGQNYAIQKVEFFANGSSVAEVSSPPYTTDWSAPVPGSYALSARVTTGRGFTLNTPALRVQVTAPPAEGWFLTEDSTTLGDWQKRYGGGGYFAPAFFSWPQQTVALTLFNTSIESIDPTSASKALLSVPNGSTRALSYWSGQNPTVVVSFADTLLHKLTLYFADPANVPVTILLRDRSSKTVLASRTVTNTTGTYESFFVKGAVEFVLSGNPQATLAGIFLDPSPYPPPVLSLGGLPPAIFSSTSLRITPDYSTNVSLASIEFSVDGVHRRTATNPPFTFLLTNLNVGTHTLQATATDQQRQSVTTNALIKTLLPPASARYLGTDDDTRGSWQGVYGSGGYMIAGTVTNLPASVTVNATNQGVYTFIVGPDDPAPLISPDDGSRIGSVWTSPFFMNFDLTLNDGLPHQVALYVFDIPGVFRDELVSVIDPVDGRVLTQTALNKFEAGRYYKWSVQGSVRFQFQTRSGALLLSGIFLDPLNVRPPSVSIFSPPSGVTVNAPSRLSTRLLFTDPAGLIGRTELYLDNQLFTEFPYRADLADMPRVLAGSHWLSAAIVDRYGARRWSAPILLNGQSAPADAVFLAQDRLSGGGWKGAYGSEGSVIAGDSDSFPALANYSINPGNVWFWDQAPQSAQAPLRSAAGRIAAAWYDDSPARTLNASFSFADGEHHALGLYFVDYDGQRTMNIRAVDTKTGARLDQRSLSAFTNGVYLVWKVRGNVTFQMSSVDTTPVLSAFFVDPGLTYDEWVDDYFGTLGDSGLDAPEADPDNDGIPNRLEFVAGLNPLQPERLWAYEQDVTTGDVAFELPFARNRTSAIPLIEYSSDLRHWADASGLKPVIRTNQTQQILQYRFSAADRSSPIYFRAAAVDNDP